MPKVCIPSFWIGVSAAALLVNAAMLGASGSLWAVAGVICGVISIAAGLFVLGPPDRQ